jgi:hypothetical protein
LLVGDIPFGAKTKKLKKAIAWVKAQGGLVEFSFPEYFQDKNLNESMWFGKYESH